MADSNRSVAAASVWETIFPALETLGDGFPEEAYQLANTHQVEVAPHLVAALVNVHERVLTRELSDDYFLHIHAMMLLTQWRETAGFAPFLELAALPGDLPEFAFGQSVTEHFPYALALMSGTSATAVEAIKHRLIEDQATDIWVRGSAMRALVVLAHLGSMTREAVLAYLRSLLAQVMIRQTPYREDLFGTLLVNALYDLRPHECMDDIRAAFQAGVIDPQHTGLDDFDRMLARPPDDLPDDTTRFLPSYNDVAADMRNWWCFDPEQQRKEQAHTREAELRAGQGNGRAREELYSGYAAPFVRDLPKIGRNDPCPCGSGRKYKKCHLVNPGGLLAGTD